MSSEYCTAAFMLWVTVRVRVLYGVTDIGWSIKESKSEASRSGAALYCIVLYCIVFAALREERSRNVRSFELQLFRFDLCVNLINALCNPLLTVQYGQ